MALFDRFRQPKWKHADPAIRLEAVNELGDDAQEVLCSLAREDADPGVAAGPWRAWKTSARLPARPAATWTKASVPRRASC